MGYPKKTNRAPIEEQIVGTIFWFPILLGWVLFFLPASIGLLLGYLCGKIEKRRIEGNKSLDYGIACIFVSLLSLFVSGIVSYYLIVYIEKEFDLRQSYENKGEFLGAMVVGVVSFGCCSLMHAHVTNPEIKSQR